MDAHERLVRLLDSRGAEYRLIHHAGVLTPRWRAVRCSVVRIRRRGQDRYVLAVVPDGELVALEVLCAMWSGTAAFPVPTEMADALTGGVPVPFSFRDDLALVTDRALLAEREIIFAAQRPDVSIGLTTMDYVRLARPSFADITRTSVQTTPLAEAA